MTPKRKINLQRVLASLNTVCTECGYSISSAEIRGIDFERMKCPKCGAVFTPKKPAQISALVCKDCGAIVQHRAGDEALAPVTTLGKIAISMEEESAAGL